MPQFAAQFPEFKQQATAYYKKISDTSARINQYFTEHRMPPGMVKAVNDTILGVIARGGEIASLAFEHALGWIIVLLSLALSSPQQRKPAQHQPAILRQLPVRQRVL